MKAKTPIRLKAKAAMSKAMKAKCPCQESSHAVDECDEEYVPSPDVAAALANFDWLMGLSSSSQ